ncbi:MAG: rhomboid family intramembrane serine protease [Flavobacteriales bacterium]|jgi:membrane associated rhomboid family serine protease|nr:rhomboid family intramembrane serine protease [Flavobacteriales bacterium]|tara:strand:+ start:15471 stop:16184 length:714 start_codon:yes stop_codon:yes gene_type:complete
MYKPSSFSQLPEIVKNLLIINGLFFFATISLQKLGIDLVKIFGLHQFQSEDFRPYQLVTHFFMHGSLTHLFFNMFALWMFGKVLENIWGAKRFLIYYIVTALGAAIIHLMVTQFQIIEISSQFPQLLDLAIEGKYNPNISSSKRLTQLVLTPTVGASGAVFGLLLAFGMLFPNTLLYVYFAIPIKAKYFVMVYGALELYSGLSNNPADNVAHFAHLGGMLFGYILIKYWKKNSSSFY